jgi:hypothetical protein
MKTSISSKKVQDRFVRVVGVKMGFDYQSVPLSEVEEILNLQSLESRRQLQDLIFLRRILLGDVDCPEILSLIDLRVPGRTRSAQIFYHQACSTNYEMNSVVPRLHRLGNLVSSNFDFFNGSNHQLKLVFYKK